MDRNDIYTNLKELGFSPKSIVDCGAAYGEWSSIIKRIYTDSNVIGVDANKWTDGNIPGTDVTEIAVLSDVDGKGMKFYRKKEHIESGTFCTGDSLFIEDTQHYQEHNTIESVVSTITLKTLLKKYNTQKIDLLKLDTQGSELLIMKGLSDILWDIEFIEIETSIVDYNKGGCSLYDIIDFLKLNFEIYDIVELHRHNITHLCQIDIIFKNINSNIKKLM